MGEGRKRVALRIMAAGLKRNLGAIIVSFMYANSLMLFELRWQTIWKK